MGLPIDLQKGEEFVMRVRKHHVFIYPQLFLAIIIGIVGVVLLTMLAPLGVIIIIIALLYAYYVIYRHNHDEWIITNQRLIDSLKKHWFHHQLSSTDLINVQDMAVVKSGVLATIFNFGDLRCETAGTDQQFVLKSIPNPQEVLELIDARRDAARRELAGAGMATGTLN